MYNANSPVILACCCRFLLWWTLQGAFDINIYTRNVCSKLISYFVPDCKTTFEVKRICGPGACVQQRGRRDGQHLAILATCVEQGEGTGCLKKKLSFVELSICRSCWRLVRNTCHFSGKSSWITLWVVNFNTFIGRLADTDHCIDVQQSW